jgi:NADH dehydrogenase FAD-containing subunit
MSVSSIFPADSKTIFAKLQEVSTLQYICDPLAKFTPLDKRHIWAAGARIKFDLWVMGIGFGIHTIDVDAFDRERISTREHNQSVPVWNHIIKLEELSGGRTRYTDTVEVRAGLKTIFIWLRANVFYRHRQRKWRKLL